MAMAVLMASRVPAMVIVALLSAPAETVMPLLPASVSVP